jgi:acetyl-CoA C-acetyltransferase
MTAEAYIVDAVRTPVGRRKGALAQMHSADLGAHVITALFDRNPSVDTLGPQAGDIARTAWLAAGYSDAVPGVTVDRQCGSSQQSIHFAAQAVLSGTADLVVAGGVQNMTQIPIASAMVVGEQFGFPTPFTGSTGWAQRYGDKEVSQFVAADMIAERWDISREAMEQYAYESHQRALRAIAQGRFDREIVPVGDFAVDEGPRADTTLEKMATLKTLRDGGRITAALASQISDAGSASLIASAAAVERFGLTPRARVHHISVRGDDPVYMLTAPIRATRYALDKAGMTLDDLDVIEINEAFASVVLAWAKELDADLSKVNVNGGAIALGHPIGATGTKLFATMLNELERTGGRYGLQTMCEGGGQANVLIIERL